MMLAQSHLRVFCLAAGLHLFLSQWPEADMLKIADHTFSSRLFTGTGKFARPELMAAAIEASGSQLVTMAIKRLEPGKAHDDILTPFGNSGSSCCPTPRGQDRRRGGICCPPRPRGAGDELAQARDPPRSALPLARSHRDAESRRTAGERGLCGAALLRCRPRAVQTARRGGLRRRDAAGRPIGSNQGLVTREFLSIIVEQANVPVVVDAGSVHRAMRRPP